MMLGLQLIENTILPFIRNPFDLLSIAHTCTHMRKVVCNMLHYWKCPQNPRCEGKCGFDDFILALRFLSGLESDEGLSNCVSYLIRFVIYPYRNTGFDGDDMVFPCLTWFPPVTSFNYILYNDWDYHDIGEDEYGIQVVSAEMIMKRICFYYCGELEYDYHNNIQCNWSRKRSIVETYDYTMMPDKICHKK